MRIKSYVVQLKSECIIEYFHYETLTQKQITESLYFHDMCNYLIACAHFIEDKLLYNINSLNNFKNTRFSQIWSTETMKVINNYVGAMATTSSYSADQRLIIFGSITCVSKLDMSNIKNHRCGAPSHFVQACKA